ncbi:MAG: hypothetical protein R3194_04685, partial [Limnobacter sp.]|nr:hypothetical protein [Limnobacter sp.]
MRPNTANLFWPAFRIAGLSLLTALTLHSQVSVAQNSVRLGGTIKASTPEEKYALNFVNADIDAVVRAVGSFTNQTYVVDPRVRGTISLVSPEPLTRTEARNALLAALRLQGFTIVESGGVSKVVPENDAKVQASPVD